MARSQRFFPVFSGFYSFFDLNPEKNMLSYCNEGEIMRRRARKGESGQVLAEYTVMLFMVVLVALTLFLLMRVFLEYGWRILTLIAWEP